MLTLRETLKTRDSPKLNGPLIFPRCRPDGSRRWNLRLVFFDDLPTTSWFARRLRSFRKPCSFVMTITGRAYREARRKAPSEILFPGAATLQRDTQKGWKKGEIRNRRFLCLPRNVLFLPSGQRNGGRCCLIFRTQTTFEIVVTMVFARVCDEHCELLLVDLLHSFQKTNERRG